MDSQGTTAVPQAGRMQQKKHPVLLIIFKRPETTSRVVKAIQQYGPSALYVAADGPRRFHSEEAATRAAREVVDTAHWTCAVHKRYRPSNLGCQANVTDALGWFFYHEPEGIVLEDDVVPSPQFFAFCGEGLKAFRDSRHVVGIGGYTASQPGSPYLSVHGSVWGWASWQNQWQSTFDVEAKVSTRDLEAMLSVASVFSVLEKLSIKARLARQVVDTWDYPWLFSRMQSRKFMLLPGGPLVANVGFGSDATHTKRRPLPPMTVSPCSSWTELSNVSFESSTIRKLDRHRIVSRLGSYKTIWLALKALVQTPASSVALLMLAIGGRRRVASFVSEWGIKK